MEDGTLCAQPALRFILSQLLNNASEFQNLVESTLKKIQEVVKSGRFDNVEQAIGLFESHMHTSRYAARIMEISMHALMQSVEALGGLGNGTLKPLSQMRSANKKHGNIGDIEVKEGAAIVAAWDAKYGKSYLRDEIEELVDKMELHPSVRVVGFVTSTKPDRSDEIMSRIGDIEEATGIHLTINDYREWVNARLDEAQYQGVDTVQALRNWVIAYAESLAQRRREIAPIDEPCLQWLSSLKELV